MTFLEFVAERLMGPSVAGSCWRCPFCDSSHGSLSIRPPKQGFPVKFKCHRCGIWGDESDLMKEFYPGEDWPRRRVRLDQWRNDFKQETQSDESVFIFRGPGSTHNNQNTYDRDLRADEFSPDADSAIAALLEYLGDPPSEKALLKMLGVAQKSLEICAEFGLHPLGLAGRCGFLIWSRDSLQRHAAECDDALCGNECRVARGLAPLSDDERERMEREQNDDEKRRRKRIRRAIRRRGKRKREAKGKC